MFQPHIFWLFDWDTHQIVSGHRFLSRNIRCEIDAVNLSVMSDDESVQIPISNVASCTIHEIPPGFIGSVPYQCKIQLKSAIQIDSEDSITSKIFLLPVNVLTGDPGWLEEVTELAEVINTILAGELPSVSVNPYERELIRLNRGAEFSEDQWPLLKPPDTQRLPTTPKDFLKLLAAVVLVILAILFVIGLIYNLLW